VVREDLYKGAGNDVGVEVGHASKLETALPSVRNVRSPPLIPAPASCQSLASGDERRYLRTLALAVGKEAAAWREPGKWHQHVRGPT
jgi:hypothetical protein